MPYFTALVKTLKDKRMNVLQSFPKFVVDDLIEIIYNVVLGNVDIGPSKTKLKRHQKALIDLVNVKGKKNRRKLIFNQKGGFLGALLPLLLSFTGKALA